MKRPQVWEGREGVFLPHSAGRLWIGLAIAVIGPILITPLVRSGTLAIFPGVPYVLVVVGATLFGRLAAAAIAIIESAILLDRYVVQDLAQTGQRTEQDVWAIVVFVFVAVVVVQVLARLDRSLAIEVRERDRLRFLSRAGDALSGSLEVEETMRQLGGVLVPALADWFAVDLVEDGTIRSVLVLHPDPAKVDLARELQRRFPTDPDSRTGAPQVIRTGTAELTEKRGPVLIQLPPSLRADERLLEDLLVALPRDMRAAFEFRHASWDTDAVRAQLERARSAWVLADRPGARVRQHVTASWSYVRFHQGRRGSAGYPRAKLRRWADRLRALSADEMLSTSTTTLVAARSRMPAR